MTNDEERDLIALVRQVAKAEILPRFRALGGDEIGEKSGQDDLVTIADTSAEIALTEGALKIMPDLCVVGEEAVSRKEISLDEIGRAGRCLIIDPIDGTWNFAKGVGCFGVLLALVENGETIWGCIYDPMGDDWMIARKGRGASFVRADGASRPVRVGAAVTPGEAFGLLPLFLFHGDERTRLGELALAMRRFGNLRCSAHEYRIMADGHADMMLTGLLHPWDHAAGVLIYQEAGGVARLLNGTDYAPTLTAGRLLCAPGEDAWQTYAAYFADLAN